MYTKRTRRAPTLMRAGSVMRKVWKMIARPFHLRMSLKILQILKLRITVVAGPTEVTVV